MAWPVTSVVTPSSIASTIGLITACALVGVTLTLNSSFSQEVKVVAKATTANANTALMPFKNLIFFISIN